MMRRLNICFSHALSCHFARLIWWMIFFTYNIPPPTNITNMLGKWLNRIDKMTKARIHIGVSVLCWSIWTCRNDMIFNGIMCTHFLQVIRLAMHWILIWSNFLLEDQRKHMAIDCNRLLEVAHNFYYLVIGWGCTSRVLNAWSFHAIFI
jgi:hypothetical protein